LLFSNEKESGFRKRLWSQPGVAHLKPLITLSLSLSVDISGFGKDLFVSSAHLISSPDAFNSRPRLSDLSVDSWVSRSHSHGGWTILAAELLEMLQITWGMYDTARPFLSLVCSCMYT
jgi:hypothetical protein